MKHSLLLFYFIAGGFTAISKAQMLQTTLPVELKEADRVMDSIDFEQMFAYRTFAAKSTSSGMIYDTTVWAHRVDSTWGVGLSSYEKLAVFNTFWNQIDSSYAAFTELPMYNWDSIVNAMRTEIAGGVSKGRFAGIIGQLSAYLNDGHTRLIDNDIATSGSFYWGKPVFYGPSGSYGVCITMLDDSSAMVYSAVPGHLLGLAPGDIILGYNGIPWKELITIILRYQLPLALKHASTDSATYHRYMISVLSNFQLFDTLNVQKCDGTLVNFPTSAIPATYVSDNLCTEQLPVSGVHKMTYTDYYTNGRKVTSGMIAGTNIGYAALYDCADVSGDSLLNPVKRLVEDSLIDGLIIDIRFNYGGSLLAFSKTFYYLSEGDFPWMGCGGRDNPAMRYWMYPYMSAPSIYGLTDTDPNFFNKKIVLLVGPGAISAGDVMQVLYKHHPHLKIIGKPTAGAFGGSQQILMPFPNYASYRQVGDFYRAEDNTFYLSHRNFPIDSFVWFDRAKVCGNEDNILTTAIQWIQSSDAVKDLLKRTPTVKIYPNPSAGKFNIVLNTPANGQARISLLDMMGKRVSSIDAAITAGENKFSFDLPENELPTGSYLLEIKGDGMETMVKKIMIVH